MNNNRELYAAFLRKTAVFDPEAGASPGTVAKNVLGGTLLGAGLLTLPAAIPMMRAGARRKLHLGLDNLTSRKLLPKSLRAKIGDVKGNSADFIADYTESAANAGKIPGVRKFMDWHFDRLNRVAPKKPGEPSHDYMRAHYKRFMSGSNREAMKHWSKEVGDEFEYGAMEDAAANLGIPVTEYLKRQAVDPEVFNTFGDTSILKNMTRPWYAPTGKHTKVESGRQKVFNPDGLFDQAVHSGMTEYEAIKSLGRSTDPDVKEYLRRMHAQKADAAGGYARGAMNSPAMALTGAGALAYNPQGPDPSFIDKLRYAFSS